MRIAYFILISFSALVALTTSSCRTGSGVRITEGNQTIDAEESGTVIKSKTATVVHVDMNERIATIRNGRDLESGFLASIDRNGKRTAILKTRENRIIGLRTADVIEGKPSINDTISPVSSKESESLSKIYRDPMSEIN